MPNPMGEMHRWVGGEKVVIFNPKRPSILIKTNNLLWFPYKGGVWIESLFSKTFDPNLMPNLRFVSKISKSGYMEAYKEDISKLIPDQIIDLNDDQRVLDFSGQHKF